MFQGKGKFGSIDRKEYPQPKNKLIHLMLPRTNRVPKL